MIIYLQEVGGLCFESERAREREMMINLFNVGRHDRYKCKEKEKVHNMKKLHRL